MGEDLINRTGVVTNVHEHGPDHVSFNVVERTTTQQGGVTKEASLGSFQVEKSQQPRIGDSYTVILRKAAE